MVYCEMHVDAVPKRMQDEHHTSEIVHDLLLLHSLVMSSLFRTSAVHTQTRGQYIAELEQRSREGAARNVLESLSSDIAGTIRLCAWNSVNLFAQVSVACWIADCMNLATLM
jgi:hypothetical protein